MTKLGSIRRSQLITTYGVGAIVAVEDESVMIAGIDNWPPKGQEIHEIRLQRKLNVRKFMRPPASSDEKARDIPAVRFPTFYSCPGCSRLASFTSLAKPSTNKCLNCNLTLVPSRFIVACEKGHVDDFPYLRWVHKGKVQGAGHNISVGSAGVSASLKDIIISCSCGLKRSMDGSFNRFSLLEVTKCTGKRPWLKDQEECSEKPRTLQRGASNVYFPVTASALAIPPWSEGAYRILQDHWGTLQFVKDRAILGQIITGMNLARDGYSVESLVEAAIQRQQGADSAGGSILDEEYQALCNGNAEQATVQDFVCIPATGATEVSDIFEQVMSVSKLKEIRALTGFTRLLPSSGANNDERIAPLSCQPVEWLPAIEIRGEGAFFRLDEEDLKRWEKTPEIAARADKMNSNYVTRLVQYNQVPTRRITARLVLIHTLAHALINQWSLDCGYPAGDLRERLYVTEPEASHKMTGFLVYTATTDAAGSLGGVVALLDRNKLRESIINALGAVSWCSADPLCVETDAAGVDSLNLAACHACVLLPETSCVEQNLLLDRAMLVGTPDKPEIGYFHSLVKEMSL